MDFIIDIEPNIKKIDENVFIDILNKYKQDMLLTEEEKETMLDYFVSESLGILKSYLRVDIKKDALVNRCDLAQHIVGKLMEDVGLLSVYPKETQDNFGYYRDYIVGHSFIVCNIQETYYLVDLTFRQFFTKEFCSLDNLKVKDDLVIEAPDPGFFIISDDFGLSVANKILKNGYIKLDCDVAKVYGDAFYFSKRGQQKYYDVSKEEYFERLIHENYNYAVDDEKFNEMYGKVM